MSNLNRRQFSSIITLSSLGLVMIKLTGCGQSQTSDVRSNDGTPVTTPAFYAITVYDIQMLGYSNLGSGLLGKNGILKATMIRDSKEVTLPYVQDGDGHKFTISSADFEQLKKGVKVAIDTTEANGHTHKVVIDPSNKAPNAESVEITDPANPSAETLFVSIENADQPRLFVQGSKPLDPASVEYCLDTKIACAADKNLWQKSKIFLDTSERQVIVSDGSLLLDINKSELPLNVRGKVKETSKLVEAILKLARK